MGFFAKDEAKVMNAVLEVCSHLLLHNRTLEIILIDDGSCDGTESMMRAFAARNMESVVFIKNITSLGINECTIQMARVARGTTLLQVPGDYTYESTELERMLEAAPFPTQSVFVVLGVRVGSVRTGGRELAAWFARNSLVWTKFKEFPVTKYCLILAPPDLLYRVGTQVGSYGSGTAQVGLIFLSGLPIATIPIHQVASSGTRSSPISVRKIFDVASSHLWLLRHGRQAKKEFWQARNSKTYRNL